MVVIEWESKKGKKRRICLGSKEACGTLPPLGQNNNQTEDNTSIAIGGKKYSDNAFILIDSNFKYGLISKQPSELSLKDDKGRGELISLKEITIEFKSTKERLLITSLISILETNIKESKKCRC